MARNQLPQTGDPNASAPFEFMVREIQALNQEINSLKREVRAVLGLVVTAAGIVASSQSLVDAHVVPYAVILLPFLLTGLAAYGFNLNAEIAAMAEQRDRLSGYVNRVTGTKIFLGRVISDHRRGSVGTALTWGLAGAIVLGSIIAGGDFAERERWFWFVAYILLMIFALLALAFAFFDLPLARSQVNRALDDEVGDIDRPATSPSSAQTRWNRFDNAIRGRRKPGLPPAKNSDRWRDFGPPPPTP